MNKSWKFVSLILKDISLIVMIKENFKVFKSLIRYFMIELKFYCKKINITNNKSKHLDRWNAFIKINANSSKSEIFFVYSKIKFEVHSQIILKQLDNYWKYLK